MNMRKFLILTVSVALCFAACKKDNEETPEPNQPEVTPTDSTQTSDTTTVVPVDSAKIAAEQLQKKLNNYRYLKTYVDRAEHPDFKFSGALDVNDFHNNRSGLRDTVTAHFDEIVAGNAMKYASVVNGGGNMDFTRVKQFVSDAQAVGLTIFGHTLAWHSQQQPGYLESLMADKELEVPESEKVDIADTEIEYSKLSGWNFWKADFVQADNNVDYSITITKDGALVSNKKKANNN